MTFDRRSILPALLVTLVLGFAPGPAIGEDEAATPPATSDAEGCEPEHQQCSAAEGVTWCCPLESTGAWVCCGAVAGVCHACDVDDSGDESQRPRK